jgi:hypothetical protein
MKRPFLRPVWITFAASLLALGIGSMSLAAQTGKTFAAGRTPDGDPDLRGIWEVRGTANWNIEGHPARKGATASRSVIVDPADGKIPYAPAALAQRNAMKLSEDPQAKCFMAGVPRITYTPGPFQLFQSAGTVIIVYQDLHTYRYIPTSAIPQVDGADFWMGSSRGHWDHDTLVVDSVSFNDQTWFDKAGNFHSEDLHVMERYTLVGPKSMQYEALIEDPKVFTRPWKMRMTAERHTEPGFRIVEDECIRDSKGVLSHTARSAQ